MGEPNWPFVGTEALAAGDVSRRTLRSRHTMVYRNVHLQNGRQLTVVTRAVAAWLWSGRQSTAAGLSAAALHGSAWIDACRPAELIRTEAGDTGGIVIHRDTLWEDEVCVVGGIPVTTPARTAFDLGRRKSLVAAVIRLDALAHATELKPVDVDLPAERHRGARGLVQLRGALDLMDGGAESPQETRTRLLLVNSICCVIGRGWWWPALAQHCRRRAVAGSPNVDLMRAFCAELWHKPTLGESRLAITLA
jgi:hypothetical protein